MFLSLAANSCSKKETVETAPASNVMIEEPKATEPTTTSDVTTATATAAAPEAEGKALVEGSDCLSCHKVDAKLIGPSYQDVAAKYTDADLDRLAQKIIDGGKGVWGDIAMTPHAGLSKEDAQKMVKYVLSLKK